MLGTAVEFEGCPSPYFRALKSCLGRTTPCSVPRASARGRSRRFGAWVKRSPAVPSARRCWRRVEHRRRAVAPRHQEHRAMYGPGDPPVGEHLPPVGEHLPQVRLIGGSGLMLARMLGLHGGTATAPEGTHFGHLRRVAVMLEHDLAAAVGAHEVLAVAHLERLAHGLCSRLVHRSSLQPPKRLSGLHRC